MAISASDVKKLRDMTGAGMMDAKKALSESDGDFDNAVKFLREKGLADSKKRADKEIGSSLEAALIIKLNKEKFELLDNIDFAEICITSSAKVEKIEGNEIIAEASKAVGIKCPVCWKISINKCQRHN